MVTQCSDPMQWNVAYSVEEELLGMFPFKCCVTMFNFLCLMLLYLAVRVRKLKDKGS